MQQKREASYASLLSYCRRPGSNRYGYHYPRDFKSRASAYSATPAFTILNYDKKYAICIGHIAQVGPTGLEPVTLCL